MNEDLKHLKWKLINQEGLTEKQADARIEEMQNFQEEVKKKKKVDKKKLNKKKKDIGIYE